MKGHMKGVLGLAIVAGLMMGTAAAQTLPPEKRLTLEEARELDAVAIAREVGTSTDYAKSIMNVQANSRALVDELRKRYAGRLAGMYIEHEPTHRLVVRLTGPGAVRTVFKHYGADTLEVVFETGAAHTLADLQRGFERSLPKLREALPGLDGGYVDERTGEVVLEVLESDKQLLASGAALRDFALPARVRLVAEGNKLDAVYGGGRIIYPKNGVNLQCTTGFDVQHISTGVYGVASAGHCHSDTGAYSYAGQDGSTHTLSWQGSSRTANSDLNWMRQVTTHGPFFYTAAGYRQVTQVLQQTQTLQGDFVCRYRNMGPTSPLTGEGCGTVTTTAYYPGSVCGPSEVGICNSTFVGVNGATCANGGGSGGPWWWNNSWAAGIHMGSRNSINECFYTSVSRLSAMGVQVLL